MVSFSLLQSAPTFLVATIIFILTIGCYLLGHRIRIKAIEKNPDHANTNLGATSGTLLALLGLLLAFTFSMSNSRFDNRRQLVIEEANAIGTAILRTDFYPDSVRKLLRAGLKEYVENRIAFYRAGMNIQKAIDYYTKADKASKKVWSIAVSYTKTDDVTTRTSMLIPALNEMIDITTTRRAAGEATIPDSIMYFLFILCVGSAFLLGYEQAQKMDWIVVIGFATMLSATVFNIIDLDRPRSGLINMDTPNEKIVELLQMFDEN
jgi:hypothetical protein